MKQYNHQKVKLSPQAILIERNNQRNRKLERSKRRRESFLFLMSLIVLIYVFYLLFGNLKSNALEVDSIPEEIDTISAVNNIEKEVTGSSSVPTENVSTAPEIETAEIVEPIKETIYNPDIPMPKEHQEYLYELCLQRGLNYHKTLALIKHESVYDANVVSSTNDYGYFQVNKINHTRLSQILETKNEPLNPYTNMNWGTYMLSDLYTYWTEEGLSGNSLDEAVWSSYNKGLTGFKENGHATTYIAKVKEAVVYVNSVF